MLVLWPMLAGALILPLLGISFLFFFPLLQSRDKKSVAFFHPYTNDGGGGERVLWCAIRALQEESPDAKVAVYTGDAATPESLAERAMQRFGVQLHGPIQVRHLTSRCHSRCIPFSASLFALIFEVMSAPRFPEC